MASIILNLDEAVTQGTRSRELTRRYFFAKASAGLARGSGEAVEQTGGGGAPIPGRLPHFPPKAKRVIYLFQSGGPSQMDLFDYKPRLKRFANTELPDSIRMGQRLTGMTVGADQFPGGAVDVPVRAAWQVRRVGQRVDAAYCARCRTISASSSRCTRRRSITIRR